MKKVIFTLLSCGTFYFGAVAQYCGNSGPSVCTPSGTLTEPGLSPASNDLPAVINTVATNTVIQFKNFDKFVFGGQEVTVQSLKLDSIGNLPQGTNVCWATNKSNNTWANQEDGCIKVTGTPNDTIGQYKLKIIVTANIGVPIQTDADAAGLKYYVRLINQGGNTPCVDTTQGAFLAYTGTEPNCPVGINDPISTISSMSVVPNPMNSSAVVSFVSEKTAIVNERITNLLGSTVSTKKVEVKAGDNSLVINRGELPAGVYFYTISEGKNSVTRRIVISE
ncbi:MAG: T9SS type A sorting domain-containing protein [Chitinophagales bacterium]|nr:T9SS type A sorting domain-containing protein [Chitinophagales bacterium]